MDYKKKYERGLECIQEILSGASDTIKTSVLQKRLQPFFPELKESEDEKIKKAIMRVLYENYTDAAVIEGVEIAEIAAWLEKRGNTLKEVTCTQEVEVGNGNIKALVTEEMSINKIKPKFHVEEYITNGDYTWKVIKVQELDYILQSQDGNTVDDAIFYVDKHFHLWTIQDAKDGDVLVDSYSKDSIIILYKGINKEQSILAHCGWNGYNFSIKTNGLGYGGLDNTNYLPATKEQRDLLFQKMHEAGYEWDVDKKELKKLSNEDDKDLTIRGFVEKKFDELQEELDAIKKQIAELEEKGGETPHPYPAFPDNFPCDGTTCTNPFQDCINCPRRFVGKGQHKWFTATDTSNYPGRKKCD